MKRTALVAAGLGVALALTACSNNNSDSSEAESSPTTSSMWTTPAAPSVDMSRFGSLPAIPTPTAPSVDCSYDTAGPAAKPVEPPNTSGVSDEGTVSVAFTTNEGPIGLTLNRAAAPCTVNSFVSLTEQGYFDDTPCHRLSAEPPLQILQCGDPSGTGTGGPGYAYANEYPTNLYSPTDPAAQQPLVYPRGTIAMANAGPNTNGSQFFLVYADSVLQPQYTVFGTISEEGLATIEKIAEAGDDGSMGANGGAPNTPVTIETASVG
ncbi:peptidylprolyl isomerase [Rhodococcus xishaensis]|uniref:Peptidyl-prolyl cis-trans isomerase n=1 Tax=Rhodococcus xishaensis TaxID=2487364 RepID=A0A3S3BLB8_9NOCA|nr:peptidylprolyl isomerase [Rhodococcus xishaensis]RVW04026.1 peptidylprolyl isomerase [Rhodococcus xishaensis]